MNTDILMIVIIWQMTMLPSSMSMTPRKETSMRSAVLSDSIDEIVAHIEKENLAAINSMSAGRKSSHIAATALTPMVLRIRDSPADSADSEPETVPPTSGSMPAAYFMLRIANVSADTESTD